MSAIEPPPVCELIPHRAELLLLERVIDHDGDSTTVRVVVGAGGWLQRSDGSTPSWLALEYMAQCAAAHEGLLARAEGRTLPLGFLASAQGIRFSTACFAHGRSLNVRARRTRGRPGLGVLSYLCSVHAAEPGGSGSLLAEGRLSVSLRGPTAPPA
jgi:predicted hotdog family 3-hydroxylacyl-ACP dehydratase